MKRVDEFHDDVTSAFPRASRERLKSEQFDKPRWRWTADRVVLAVCLLAALFIALLLGFEKLTGGPL